MKVLLTGATGFVGSHLTPALLAAGHEVQAVVRAGSAKKLAPAIRDHASFHPIEADVLDPDSLRRIEPGAEAVIHLVGIIEEKPSRGITFTRLHVDAVVNMVKAATRIGAGRFVHMSALGTADDSRARYHRTKYRGEHAVKSSNLPYVILRPSLIFGPGDGFVNTQKKFVQPIMPVIVPGSGKNLFQPVAIENVVEGFVKALTLEKATNQIYEVGGPDRISFDGIIDMIAKAKGVTSFYKVHVPVPLMKAVVRVMQHFPGFPVNVEQLTMLNEDNTCEARRFYDEFDIQPLTFNVEALRRYI